MPVTFWSREQRIGSMTKPNFVITSTKRWVSIRLRIRVVGFQSINLTNKSQRWPTFSTCCWWRRCRDERDTESTGHPERSHRCVRWVCRVQYRTKHRRRSASRRRIGSARGAWLRPVLSPSPNRRRATLESQAGPAWSIPSLVAKGDFRNWNIVGVLVRLHLNAQWNPVIFLSSQEAWLVPNQEIASSSDQRPKQDKVQH